MPDNAGFLGALFGAKPPDAYVLVWTKRGKKSAWFTDVGAAERYALGQPEDTWFGVGLSPADFGPRARCVTEQVMGIPGLWCDLDVEGPAHRGDHLIPSMEAALALVHQLPLSPSYVVNSGHGLQAYWLFREPWVFKTAKDQAAAAQMERDWLDTVRTYAPDYRIDPVGDLARIMRVPGTANCKIPGEPVRAGVVEADGPRYDPKEFKPHMRLTWQGAPAADPTPPNLLSEVGKAAASLGKLASHRYEDYTEWLNVGFALTTLGDQGLALWDTWSTDGGKHKAGECAEKWRTMAANRPKGITLASLNHWAKSDARGSGPHRGQTIPDYEAATGGLGYNFRLNTWELVVEVNGRPITDGDLRVIRGALRDMGFNSPLALEDAIWTIAQKDAYHPLREYLDGCEAKYDGTGQVERLAGYFTDATHPRPLFSKWLRMWMIGAVAKAMGEGLAQNAMLVLDGPQRVGKSFFAKWLASGVPRYFTEGHIDPDNKDCLIRYMNNFIWETAELGATTRRADVDALKDFISRGTVTVRVPYGHFDVKRPAVASLFGTINNSGGFLVDPTGNRRFLVSYILKIDWAYSKDVDVEQVWGEVVRAYRAGEAWEPTSEELVTSEETNEGYLLPNPLESYMLKYFAGDPGDQQVWIATGDIVAHLFAMGYRAGTSRALAMEVASYLQREGYTRSRRLANGLRLWGYYGLQSHVPVGVDVGDMIRGEK